MVTSSAALEIGPEKWSEYFRDLGTVYAGWSVTVEVLLEDFGDQWRIDNLPLRGLTYDTKGSQAGDILIEAGDVDLPFEVYRISMPRVVRVATLQPGAEVDLQIESHDGQTALVRIRAHRELPPGNE